MSASSAPRAVTLLSKRYRNKPMVDLGRAEDTLFATVLSARTRDEQVLKVYPSFRKRFPTLASVAKADVGQIAAAIATIGLYRNKAKSLKALATALIERHKGRVPKTMEELVALPGVGRKTASCVLSFAFGLPAVAVDTHVFRIAHRLGWTKGRTPEAVESDIKTLVPEKWWSEVNRTFVPFGRDVCRPGKPQCWRCPVATLCAYRPKTPAPLR
jgi:endonuclease-3